MNAREFRQLQKDRTACSHMPYRVRYNFTFLWCNKAVFDLHEYVHGEFKGASLTNKEGKITCRFQQLQ